MKYCSFCKINHEDDIFYFEKDIRYKNGGKWRCRIRKNYYGAKYRSNVNNDPIRKQIFLDKQKLYSKQNPNKRKYKSYKNSDLKKKRDTVEWLIAREIMQKPCYYCRQKPSNGLERIDNSLGHSLENILPCCEKCNIILGDIPFEAKNLLKDGLKKIYKQNLLKDWIIPTKRRKYEDI